MNFLPYFIKTNYFSNATIYENISYILISSVISISLWQTKIIIFQTNSFLYFFTNLFQISFNSVHKHFIYDQMKPKTYMKYFIRVLNIFIRYNRNAVGSTFLYVLIPFSIIHTYSIVWLFLIDFKDMNRLAYIVIILGIIVENVIIFSIYIFLCSFSKHIYSSRKTIYKKILTKRYDKDIKILFSFVMFETIHNKRRRFGFTYSSFGLMTKFTFLKYIFIYGNIMMKLYKNAKRK